MKRSLILILCIILLIPLAACGPEEAIPAGWTRIVIAPDDDAAAVTEEQREVAQEYYEQMLGQTSFDDFKVDFKDDSFVLLIKGDVTEEQARELTALPVLSFRDEDGNLLMDGSDVDAADVSYQSDGDSPEGRPVIQISFTAEGTQRFADVSQRYLNQQIALYLDDVLLTNPTVVAPITDGRIIVSGLDDINEASRIVAGIKASAFPFGFKVVSVDAG